MMGKCDQAAIGRGATLALRGSMCDRASGTACARASIEHRTLAGRSPTLLDKQSPDVKPGRRPGAPTTWRDRLSDEERRDLAALYSVQRRDTLVQHVGVELAVPILASNGLPMRNGSACATCHNRACGAQPPWILNGLPQAYLHDQLDAFRMGQRANDINQQTRNAELQLTEQESAVLVKYYAGRYA